MAQSHITGEETDFMNLKLLKFLGLASCRPRAHTHVSRT